MMTELPRPRARSSPAWRGAVGPHTRPGRGCRSSQHPGGPSSHAQAREDVLLCPRVDGEAEVQEGHMM